MAPTVQPTGREIFFDQGAIIVSKTDLKGRITYANQLFCQVAGYREDELLGQPHSIVRHPDMPRAVFKLLWDTLMAGEEIFAYVKNMARNGDHYWVFAHATPTFDADRQITTGFHSNRRVPSRAAVDAVGALYADVLRVEGENRNGKDALAAGCRHLADFITSRKTSYDELVLAL